MSDKGREAIERLVRHIYGLGTQDNVHMTLQQMQGLYKRLTADLVEVLRAHGWLHENDVVEGRCLCAEDYKVTFCLDYEHTGCSGQPDMKDCDRARPATVKDLIK